MKERPNEYLSIVKPYDTSSLHPHSESISFRTSSLSKWTELLVFLKKLIFIMHIFWRQKFSPPEPRRFLPVQKFPKKIMWCKSVLDTLLRCSEKILLKYGSLVTFSGTKYPHLEERSGLKGWMCIIRWNSLSHRSWYRSI